MGKEAKLSEEELKLPYDWHKLEPIQTALTYLQKGEEGIPYAKEAVKMVLENTGASDPCLIETVTDPRVVQLTVQNYAKRFFHADAQQTIGDFTQYHWSILENYLGKNKDEFNKDLEEFKGMKYADFQKTKEKLEVIVSTHEKHGLNTKEEYENAKKTLEKYENMLLLSVAKKKYIQRLNEQVEDRVIKNDANDFYNKRKEEQKKAT